MLEKSFIYYSKDVVGCSYYIVTHFNVELAVKLMSVHTMGVKALIVRQGSIPLTRVVVTGKMSVSVWQILDIQFLTEISRWSAGTMDIPVRS